MPNDFYADISSNILKVSSEKNHRENGARRIGLSQLGSCIRQLWYTKTNAEKDIRDLDAEITFAIGNKIEEWVFECLEEAGYIINDRQLTVEYKGISGHIDGMLYIPETGKRFIVEVKTASAYAYRLMETRGLETTNKGYYYQLQGYIAASGADGGLFIMINKEARKSDVDRLSHPLQVTKMYTEWVAPNDSEISELADIVNALDSNTIPDRPYSKVEKFPCTYCAFLSTCWDFPKV